MKGAVHLVQVNGFTEAYGHSQLFGQVLQTVVSLKKPTIQSPLQSVANPAHARHPSVQVWHKPVVGPVVTAVCVTVLGDVAVNPAQAVSHL